MKNKQDFICDICGKKLKTRGGLKSHKRLAHPEGEAQQSSLRLNNNREVKMEQTQAQERFPNLLKLFEGDKRGLLSPPPTEEEQKVTAINLTRRSIVQTIQVLIEVAALLHPERLEAVLEEFKDEPDFRRILILDWLDWTYKSTGQVHVLEGIMIKALKKQAVDSGILAEDDELPEPPQTKLGPILEELASRIQPTRR